MSVKERLSEIRKSLPDGVTLVAVSKFHPVEAIFEAYNAGQRIFGESRVQELVAKQPLLPSDVEWHFIGTLQSNKVKYIAPFVSMIQSVDNLRLIEEISRQAIKCERTINVLIEVHIAEEASKHGFSPAECFQFFSEGIFGQYGNVCVCGLMGMATFTDNLERVSREFAVLRNLFEDIKALPAIDKTQFRVLSMGMSDDYKTAIKQGSTMVRIGTSIFGNR